VYFAPFLFASRNSGSRYLEFHTAQSRSILTALLAYTLFYVVGVILLALSSSWRYIAFFASAGGISYAFFAALYTVAIRRASSGSQNNRPIFGWPLKRE